MSSTRCPTLNWLLLPLLLVVAAVIVGAATSRLESALLYTLTAAFTLAHIHYGVQVVSEGERRELLWGIQKAAGHGGELQEGRLVQLWKHGGRAGVTGHSAMVQQLRMV
jgi:hypothetical protein